MARGMLVEGEKTSPVSGIAVAAEVQMSRQQRSNVRAIVIVVVVIAVLVIVGVVALVFSASLTGLVHVDRARIAAAGSDAWAIRSAATMHMVQTGECATIDELLENGDVPAESTDDPWGNPYRIRCGGDDVDVTSDGPDQEADTEDDIAARSPFR